LIVLIHADVRAYTATRTGPLFHALFSDAPYELGFMNRSWDKSGIAFKPATWRALAQSLYPGGFGMVFGSSRGWHRLAVAIEDAGLIIHPTIFLMGYAYGSGFPKATRIDTAIDRAAGHERGLVERMRSDGKRATGDGTSTFNASDDPSATVGPPVTPLAAAWAGHRYGLQALKPALEPIIVFQKPYEGRPVESIARTGAGALNIDAGRVGTGGDRASGGLRRAGHEQGASWRTGADQMERPAAGRWPANLVLLHLPECGDACAPGCAVAALGAQSGETTSPATVTRGGNRASAYGMAEQRAMPAPGDTGTAARYFYNADYMYERLEAADAVRYVAKASTAEREAGLEEHARQTLQAQYRSIQDSRPGYTYQENERGNIHPTVKPIALARYLASLLLPPDLYAPRRLLVPFAGVGSEMIGAELAGWEEVTGVEREAEHIPVARARLAWWRRAARRVQSSDPRTILAQLQTANTESLFDLEAE
jgi:hypothetical protein